MAKKPKPHLIIDERALKAWSEDRLLFECDLDLKLILDPYHRGWTAGRDIGKVLKRWGVHESILGCYLLAHCLLDHLEFIKKRDDEISRG